MTPATTGAGPARRLARVEVIVDDANASAVRMPATKDSIARVAGRSAASGRERSRRSFRHRAAPLERRACDLGCEEGRLTNVGTKGGSPDGAAGEEPAPACLAP